jgi:transcriptional regulator with XRE-family HTH domain
VYAFACTLPTYCTQEEHEAIMETTIGQRVRQARRRLGLSQAQLATRINVSRTVISRLEHGQHNLAYAEILTLASVLDLTVWELLNLSLPHGLVNVGALIAACSREGREAFLQILIELTEIVKEQL